MANGWTAGFHTDSESAAGGNGDESAQSEGEKHIVPLSVKVSVIFQVRQIYRETGGITVSSFLCAGDTQFFS